MSSAKINGIELHYQTHGEGEAIVFAHGAGGNLLSWWQQIPFFSQNYKCIVFDHRGFGHSLDAPDGPGGEAFVDDLRGLLDHLEIDSAHLVAQSMGGRTALGFALAHPERTRSLLMADTPGGIAEPELADTLAQWREDHASTIEIGVRALSSGFQAKRPDMAMLYMQISRTNPPRPASATAGQTDGPMAADLGKMKTPTLFIVGDDDELTPPHVIELAAKYVPGARYTRVPEAGHSVYFEKPDVFNFEMNRFLKSL